MAIELLDVISRNLHALCRLGWRSGICYGYPPIVLDDGGFDDDSSSQDAELDYDWDYDAHRYGDDAYWFWASCEHRTSFGGLGALMERIAADGHELSDVESLMGEHWLERVELALRGTVAADEALEVFTRIYGWDLRGQARRGGGGLGARVGRGILETGSIIGVEEDSCLKYRISILWKNDFYSIMDDILAGRRSMMNPVFNLTPGEFEDPDAFDACVAEASGRFLFDRVRPVMARTPNGRQMMA